MATLITLVTFTETINGSDPTGSLLINSDGDLFGTTSNGPNGDGTVFEIVDSEDGYASTPTTLVDFDGNDGANPFGSLIADSNGDLFGETYYDGFYGGGTIFEIENTPEGYAASPTVLANFGGTSGTGPLGSLIADANGDLFGTTSGGGADDAGTVFELAKTASGYASTVTTLVTFNFANGEYPGAGLIFDANGDLFGTTEDGGGNGNGSVFEIAKTASGYANTPTTLVAFDGTDGSSPLGSLIMDANGNLFGTTNGGGDNGLYSEGTVFEIPKTAAGYASTPITLATFDGLNGSSPFGSLIMDADGDLFGTTHDGGTDDDGTVFEIANNGSVADPIYSSTVITLANFDQANGANPQGSLIADGNGDLFGTTAYDGPGAGYGGTVFEITDSGFVTATSSVPEDFYNTGASAIPLQNTDGQIFFLQEAGAGGNVGNYGAGWNMVGADSFYTDGNTDILLQNTDGQMYLLDMQGNSVVGGGNVGNDGSAWDAVATGGFFSDGDQGIALQNTDGQIYLLDMQDGNVVGGDNIGNYGSAWHVAATGDFFGDGNTDLVLQNTDGDIYLFDVRDTVVASSNVGNFGADWTVVGAGKFLSDGNTDLVLQNTDGQIGLMDVQDGNYVGFTDIGNFGASWQVKQVGDFFADGHSGIALQNTNGQIFLMELNGGTVSQSANLGNYGSSWHLPLLPG